MNLTTSFVLWGVVFFFALTSFSQQNSVDSITHQGYQRKFMVHTPPGYSVNNETSLVITLHGGSGNMLNVQGFTEMNLFSNLYGFVAVYPQGYAETNNGGYSWADGRGTIADAQNIDDVGFINKLIDTLISNYAIDTTKIYSCGFSNGGFMMQRLGCETPESFAAVGALGCSMDTALIQTCSPAQPLPTAYFSGTNDPEVPYEGGTMSNPLVDPVVPVDTAVQFWVENNECQSSSFEAIPDTVLGDNSQAELYKYTDCACDADVYFYKLINHGHTWPGVPISQFPQLGNTNEDIHASNELWKFFSMHSNCSFTNQIRAEEKHRKWKLYPNPSRDHLLIKSEYQIEKIILYDHHGRLISTTKNNKLETTALAPGVYSIAVKFRGTTNIYRRKFIKK